MALLAAAVVVLAVVCVLNLVLTLGMARRMRQYAALLDGLEPPELDGLTRPVGSAVGEFRGVAVDGTTVDRQWLTEPTRTEPTVVAFFSPGCPACRELVPLFVATAATTRALAVVEDGPAGMENYVSDLAPAATVLVGEQARSAVTAFHVRGFPAVCTVDTSGVVSATGTHLLGEPHPVGR
jgi:hypothetical protein